MIRPLVLALLLLAAAPAAARDFAGKVPGPFAQSIPGAPTGNDGKVAKAPVVGTYIGVGTCSNCGTMGGFAFGAAASDRYIACWGIVGTSSTFTGMTIGGVAATNAIAVNNSTQQLKLGVALVPTGTTGSVVFNYSGTGTVTVQCYSLRGTSNGLSPTVASASTTPLSSTPTVVAGSFGSGHGDGFFAAPSFTGMTQNVFSMNGILQSASASVSFAVGGTPTIGVANAGASNPTLGTAVWAPN